MWPKTAIAIVIYIGASWYVPAYAQSPEISANAKDTVIMKKITDALPSSDREVNQSANLNYGPLRYRLSTAQGFLFQSTGQPLIVRQNPDDGLSDRIVGGVPTKPGEFPWQVALLNSRFGTLFCGGSHLGSGWIVTAAHCVYGKNGDHLKKGDVLVLTGTTSLVNGGDRLSLIDDPVFHEGYDPATKLNDIALLHFKLVGELPAITIPATAIESSLVSPGKQLTVSGWGAVTEGGNISAELLKVGVPVTNQTTCSSAYSGISSDKQVCAGIGGRDSCQGDSGGPLIGIDNKTQMLVGVVSFGKGCARDYYPGVYTRVAAYRDWIRQRTGI